MSTTHRILLCVLPALFVTGTAPSQEKAPRRNGKAGDFAVFPLGAIGGSAEVLADQDTIRILSVLPKGPGATAGLRPGDHVLAAAGAKFGKHTRNIDVGGKDATGDVSRVSKQRQTCGKDFVQLTGEDASALGHSAHGGTSTLR